LEGGPAGESSLAVVDEQGRYLRLIPLHRLLGVLLREHDEDMSRLAGVLHRSEEAQSACEERVSRRLWHRLPWLVVGLVGALVSADVVGVFEGQLATNVILAFFLPGVVYLADAVGTQTETLVVRGLSVGIPIGRVLAREALTGLLIGLVVALIFLPIAILRWGRGDVALAVSLALLAACSMATVVAICLPWLLQRFGRDPAFGSGPLATLIQDLLSILTYFWIANLLVK
jgi:magnesium transporter